MELSPIVMQFVVFLPVIIAFYFLLIRPQQKRQKEHQQMLEALQKNDRVLTAGGLMGRIVTVQESEIVLEIATNVQVHIARSAVTQKLGADTETPARTASTPAALKPKPARKPAAKSSSPSKKDNA